MSAGYLTLGWISGSRNEEVSETELQSDGRLAGSWADRASESVLAVAWAGQDRADSP